MKASEEYEAQFGRAPTRVEVDGAVRTSKCSLDGEGRYCASGGLHIEEWTCPNFGGFCYRSGSGNPGDSRESLCRAAPGGCGSVEVSEFPLNKR